MGRYRFIACCGISALVSGCMATVRGTIPADRATAIETAVRVAGKMGMGAEKGPVDAVVEGGVPPYIRSAGHAPQADLRVWTGGPNGYQAEGAIYLTTAGAGQVRYEALFGTNSTVSADAFGGLFFDLVRQQVRLDRGEQFPHVNPMKSSGTFVGLTMLTPVAGMHYTIQSNPYAAGSSRPWLYAMSALGDVVMVGLLTAAALVDDSNTRSGLVIAGVSTGAGWRLLSLLNIMDVSEYNAVARTDFDLEAAARSIDAAQDR